ncbi:hypothetical protein E2320_017925 [Naja naja]|nr:hypothetical protein E2320_017925 [Naja naja]
MGSGSRLQHGPWPRHATLSSVSRGPSQPTSIACTEDIPLSLQPQRNSPKFPDLSSAQDHQQQRQRAWQLLPRDVAGPVPQRAGVSGNRQAWAILRRGLESDEAEGAEHRTGRRDSPAHEQISRNGLQLKDIKEALLLHNNDQDDALEDLMTGRRQLKGASGRAILAASGHQWTTPCRHRQPGLLALREGECHEDPAFKMLS